MTKLTCSRAINAEQAAKRSSFSLRTSRKKCNPTRHQSCQPQRIGNSSRGPGPLFTSPSRLRFSFVFCDPKSESQKRSAACFQESSATFIDDGNFLLIKSVRKTRQVDGRGRRGRETTPSTWSGGLDYHK